MIFGHLAIAGIAKLTRFRRESLLFLSLASLGPDLADKTANMLFGMPGRGMSHSLIFFAGVIFICGLIWRSFKLNTDTLTAGVLMWGSHLIGDFVQFQVLFWPFLGPLEPGTKFQMAEKVRLFYFDQLYPDQFWMEMFCITALVTLLLSRLFTTKKPAAMVIIQSKPSSAELDSL
ncbi:MAG: metal-dependent hydrolase [Desulfomonilaceae bacterium]